MTSADPNWFKYIYYGIYLVFLSNLDRGMPNLKIKKYN
jgi:hypothetical protein